MAKIIELTQGKIAKVSDKDYAKVSGIKWYASFYKGKWYARTSAGNGKKEYLHRVLIGARKGQEVKFMNGDSLDCSRENMIIATRSEIRMGGSKTCSRKTSKYKGVFRSKQPSLSAKPWVAYIKLDGYTNYIGFYASELEAAHAYDDNASLLFGKHARLNFPTSGG